MAISQGDGSIILSTKVDTTGIKAFAGSLKKLFATMGVAFGIKELLRFSNEAGKVATQTEASVQRIYDIYGKSSNVIGDFIDANAQALGMSKSAMASFSAVYGNLFSVWADQATNAELTNQYLQMTAVVASKTGRTVEDVQERVRSGLLGNTEAIEDLGVFVNVKTIEMTDAFQRMADGKSWEQLDAYTQQQIRTMAILEQATSKYGTEVADTSALTRSAFGAAYENFKNTWGQIVNTVLLPILEVATQILNIFTVGLQSLFNLSGGILGDMENSTDDISNNIQSSVGGQEDLTEATEDTNEALNQSVAGFDELNTIQKDTGSNKKGGSTSGLANALGITKKDSKNGKKIGSEISKTLTSIMGVVSLALLAVGLILLFTGNIAWGIGFIIAGASLLSITMGVASEYDYTEVIQMITTIMGIAGGALLALGIILLYIGGVVGKGVAIGMIIAGGALIVSAVIAQAGIKPSEVEAWLSLIMGIAGGALLALGVILCMVGSVPMGVGMIIAGAVSLVSAVLLNFDSVKNSIKGWVAVIMAIAGAALLVLGIILVATGAGLALGIALIAAGAISLVTPIALNWNTIVEKVKGLWKSIKDYWNNNISKFFTKEWWLALAKKAGNGLITGFENAVNSVITLFEKMINFVVNGLNKISISIPDWVPEIGGKKFGVNLDNVSLKRVSIPRLAQGKVIPPNREFMAVLGDQKSGTNIETPLDTMVEAFNMALRNNNSGFNGRIEVPVIIDGREILRAVRSTENAVGTQTVYGGFANAY